MRTLVISDIHGNIDALQAIDESYDNIICMGDIVDYGPNPRECIEFLRERNLHRTRGNHDDAVAFRRDCRTRGPYRHLSVSTRPYSWAVLDRANIWWLGEPATSVFTELDGFRLFACHGAPSSHMFKYLRPDTPDEELAREAALIDADIIVTGHSHLPFIKRFDSKLLVNVGSVGQPRDGIPKACYAIIDNGDVQIRRVEYDVEAVVARTMALPVDERVLKQLAYLLEKAKAPPPAEA
ncbi:MAG: metallophosphoesterase family protein [Thermoleophilia bacterium]|nr:metallophosphoesterase family protein [Thermoleophilia bacterium]